MQSFLNQLIYFGYFQSVFLLLIYLFSSKNRKNINGYIAFFVFVLMIGLSGRILYTSNIFGQNYRLVALSEFATLLFGPTVYLFTRSSLFNKFFSYEDIFHYVPAIFYNIAIVIFIILPSDQIIQMRQQSGEQYRIILLLIGIGLAFNIVYWIMALHLFLKFKKEILNEVSYTLKTRFFVNFLIAIGICLFCWLMMYCLSITGAIILSKLAWQLVWFSIAIIILFIAFYGMKEPQLFKITPLLTNKKYTQSKLTITDLELLKEQLDALMAEKKPYLNNKLLKAELAEMLGVSNPEMARLLNESIGMNFFEYVNYYRIKEFIDLVNSDKAKNLTFFGLAQEAGFNSKTTFNKSFKKLMGVPPSEYFK